MRFWDPAVAEVAVGVVPMAHVGVVVPAGLKVAEDSAHRPEKGIGEVVAKRLGLLWMKGVDVVPLKVIHLKKVADLSGNAGGPGVVVLLVTMIVQIRSEGIEIVRSSMMVQKGAAVTSSVAAEVAVVVEVEVVAAVESLRIH